ncbi:DUF2065 domain-containing protein [Desulfobaculum bizertense]|uniref:DUF2065 domain-containing protein n=1 Tax=Desulfobaculum bizertense DSM 18034 TaxID=1121442 RepID=A0A1T4WSN7_9BACT|nr:DUF2065 domain-containing protein [Desulfobaculum bizertense]UIJ37240.1 DUF2065 domain-containing protein [Desulfobaculum bizertense]SKA80289.1 hypothetical protein SAMN02745702_02636 [Desulfobaculum bizertense DSM 18034]
MYTQDMHIDWKLFLTAMGLALVMEGVFYALAAPKLPSLFKMMAERSSAEIRIMGLMTALIGLLVVWLVRT